MDIRGKSSTSGSCSMARFNYQRVRGKTRGFVHFGDKDRDTSRFFCSCKSDMDVHPKYIVVVYYLCGVVHFFWIKVPRTTAFS